MFTPTTSYFEILAYVSEQESHRPPCDIKNRKNYATALQMAEAMARLYGYIELNKVYVNINDRSDVQGTELMGTWTEGKKNK